MNILLLSKDTDVIESVRVYATDNDHHLTVISETARARNELDSHAYDAVLFDCSIRPSELIDFSSEADEMLTDTVVLLIGPLDPNQREHLGRRLSAHYSIDKPLRGKAFHDAMERVAMRSTIVRKAGLIGRSPVMEETVQTIMQVGPTPINILVTGESGSGKEVIARAIHAVSRRSNQPFFAVNCAALAESILESELFGHEKGSFTGANTRRIGIFEKVDGGTIFLDEIGEISPSTQIRLLRVLEEREIMRVGGTEIIPVDVRIIAATNQNLEELVRKEVFRRDLYYRIKVLEVKVPPLRNRPEDVPLLIDRITRQYASDNGLAFRRFDTSAKSILSRSDWPGNVRELRNVIESILALTTSPTIGIDDIPPHILREIDSHNMLPVRAESATDRTEREIIFRTLLEIKNDVEDIKRILMDRRFVQSDTEIPRMVEVLPVERRHEPTLEDVERQAIIDALDHTGGNRRKTADMLGIGERTLYRKLKQFDLS